MRTMVRTAAAVTVAMLLTACGGSGGYTSQQPADFEKTVATAGVVVLDVRTAGEFAAGHVANAVNIDVESADFDSQIAELDPAQTYAVYCHSGRRSGIAAGKMTAAGFTHVYNLSGGINAWMAAGLPLVQ